MSKSFGVEIKGFDQMINKLYRMHGSALKPIVEDCLEAIPPMVNPNLESDMKRHARKGGGRTLKSLETDNPIEWNGTTASMPVGFHIRKGGLASVFLMYGTAQHAPNHPGTDEDQKLYDDIMGDATDKKIARKQQEIFEREIEKLWKTS